MKSKVATTTTLLKAKRKGIMPRKKDAVSAKEPKIEEVKPGQKEETTEVEKVEVVKQKAKAKSAPKKTTGVKTPHGQKYAKVSSLVDKKRKYSFDAAIDLVKKVSYTSFDSTVDVHIRTATKKGQDMLRGLVELPAGSAREPKVVIADEAIIEKIKQGKIDFDILLATPALMPKLATVAKILGPKGLMPNPKSGTVVDDPEKALAEFKKGRVEYKADSLGNIHVGVGKVSWSADKLESNISALLTVIPANRIHSVYIAPTMGPSIALDF